MNKELEKAIKNMQKFVRCKQNMTAITAKEMSLVLKELERLQEDYIPKDKIREKIEELKKDSIKYENNMIKRDIENFWRIEFLKANLKKQGLQELLEGK